MDTTKLVLTRAKPDYTNKIADKCGAIAVDTLCGQLSMKDGMNQPIGDVFQNASFTV